MKFSAFSTLFLAASASAFAPAAVNPSQKSTTVRYLFPAADAFERKGEDILNDNDQGRQCCSRIFRRFCRGDAVFFQNESVRFGWQYSRHSPRRGSFLPGIIRHIIFLGRKNPFLIVENLKIWAKSFGLRRWISSFLSLFFRSLLFSWITELFSHYFVVFSPFPPFIMI